MMQYDINRHPSPRILSDYVHGRMNDNDSALVEQHLETCDGCCEELRHLNHTGIVRLLRSADACLTRSGLPHDEGAASIETASTPVPSLPKTAEDRYEIIAEIGRGGMGIVYRARDRRLRRDVAIKTLQDNCSQPSFKDRFVREAQITAMLDHPGVPATHELGHFADGRPFMAMRLVRGETLKSRLKNTPDMDAMLQIFARLCDCVAFAHSQQIIHRDIKPANVMVGEFGEVQVMDWGLAKHVAAFSHLPPQGITLRVDSDVANESADTDECLSTLFSVAAQPVTVAQNGDQVPSSSSDDVQTTRAGTVLGTVAYMSPEQALGQVNSIGPASDVFSLGAVLCDILTGSSPRQGSDQQAKPRSAGIGDTCARMQHLDRSTADPDLIALARECLAPAPHDRPKDATVVARRIDEWQQDVRKRLDDARMAQVRSDAKVNEHRKRQRIQLALITVSVLFIGIVWQLYASMQNQEREFATRESHRKLINIASANAELKMFTAAFGKAIESPGIDHGLWEEAKIHLIHATDINQKDSDHGLATTIETATADYERAHSEAVADDILLSQLSLMDALHGHPDGPGGRPGLPAPHEIGPPPLNGFDQAPPAPPGNHGRRPLPPHHNGPPSHPAPSEPGHPLHPPPHVVVSMAEEIERRGSRAFADYGFPPRHTSPEAAADHLRSRPQWFQEELVKHLEIWLHYAAVGYRPTAPWISDLLAVLDPDPFRIDVRSAIIDHDHESLFDAAQRSDIERQPAEFVWSVAAMVRGDSHELANQLMAAAQLNHLDSSVINRDLAHELQAVGRVSEAIGILMLRAATQTDPTAKANALLELSNSLHSEQRLKEAMTVMHQAMRHQRSIIPEERFVREISLVEDAEFTVSLLTSMLAEEILLTADAWIALGNAHQKNKDWQAAGEAYKKGLSIMSHRDSVNEQAKAALEHCTSMIAAETDTDIE